MNFGKPGRALREAAGKNARWQVRARLCTTPGSRSTIPSQFNSYTTDMVKGVILAFRAASNARDVNCVVFTGAGDKAFCTGGNTKEYAEYYAGHPQEYRQYMRLFNDMVSAILACDKPVICRVNGMRIGGGQEIGMACDFSVAQDLARFGQAGPKHGSAPIGGATDFLPPYDRQRARDGRRHAVRAVLGAQGLSLGHRSADVVPALKVDGKFIANPLVETQRCHRRLRPHRVRRAQDRRGCEQARRCWRAAQSISRCSTRRSRSCAPSCC